MSYKHDADRTPNALPTIDADDVACRVSGTATDDARLFELFDGELPAAIIAAEKLMIARALVAYRGNRAAAARRLGIHRQLLYSKLRKYGLAHAQQGSASSTSPSAAASDKSYRRPCRRD